MVVAGGVSFIVAALAFMFVFGYLAANFDYLDILEGSASDVLPRLRAGGAGMRAAWAVYAFLPLLLMPSAVGRSSLVPIGVATPNNPLQGTGRKRRALRFVLDRTYTS